MRRLRGFGSDTVAVVGFGFGITVARFFSTAAAAEKFPDIGFDFAQRRQPFIRAHTEVRHRGQQRAGVWMLRRGEDALRGAAFHDFTVVQHHHLARDIRDHAQVMRNHQNRHAELGLQFGDEFEDLRLNGDIQRGGRLVGNEQRRVANQRHRNHGALAHAAGQLERVAIQRLARMREADDFQHFAGQFHALGAADITVQKQRFRDLVADGMQRRQRHHRLLENQRETAAAQIAHGAPARVERDGVDGVDAFLRAREQNLPGRDGGVVRQ